MVGSSLKTEFFNYVSESDLISKLETEIRQCLHLLPEYEEYVHRLGVFLASKSDKDAIIRADEYTQISKPEPSSSPHAHLMTNFFFKNVQSILVFLRTIYRQVTPKYSALLESEFFRLLVFCSRRL